MGIRTFFALDLDPPTLDGLVAVRAQLDVPGAKIKWVARDNLHVTLKFLGDIPEPQVAEVCALAAQAATRVEPFEFGIECVSVVPPRGKARMVWAGVADPTGRMAALHAELETALAGIGKQEARGFNPHITLARMKFIEDSDELRRRAAAYTEQRFGTIAADELVVYSSRLTPQGPIYTPIARASLGG